MADAAKVLSVEALKDFRVALITFTEEARNALGGVDMELKRMRDWLERDQLSYWQTQVKRRSEAVMTARTELHRRQIAQQGSDAISDTEQKEALREAQRKLRVAEEKVDAVKKLIPIFHHSVSEYASRSTPLVDHLTGGIDRSLNSLARMIDSLEAYLALKAPSAPPLDFGAGGQGPQSTVARAAGVPADAAGGGDAGAEPAGIVVEEGEATPAGDRQGAAAASVTGPDREDSP